MSTQARESRIVLIATINLASKVFNEYKNRHPVRYCDEITAAELDKHAYITCKLRYPILNAAEIRKVKDENNKLKDTVIELKDTIEDIKQTINDEMEEIWGADIPQIDY